jgi:Family of unknown function (DUF5694)
VTWLGVPPARAQTAPPSPLEQACTPDAPRLLVLGSYHMANPGQDSVNLKADDVLTPRRQAEIADVVARLAAYQPTKVALEAALVGSPWPGRYEAWRAGSYTLGRNEIEQIGFRVAAAAALPRVHAVDFPMWMDGRVPAEIGEARPRPPVAGAVPPPAEPPTIPAIFKEMEALVSGGQASVREILAHANSERAMREDHATYIRQLRPDPYSNALYGTTNPIANWYARNLRIFTNLYRLAEPGDRVLLLIGSGHLTILRRLAADAPDVCLVDAAPYLQPAPR